jgi:hypothetical protein
LDLIGLPPLSAGGKGAVPVPLLQRGYTVHSPPSSAAKND